MLPLQTRVPVVENVRLARDTYRVRLAAPEVAARILPGQFVMLREPDRTDPLLARPLALYDTYLDAAGRPAGIDIVYLVVGKMTRLMAGWKQGREVELWGPLGNGFARPDCRHLLMVAGGIGQTPFLALARQTLGLRGYGLGDTETPRRRDAEARGHREGESLDVPPPRVAPRCVPTVSLCYGARSADLLACVEDFESVGVEVHLATNDGSVGHCGYVTELAAQLLHSPPLEGGVGGGRALPLPDYIVGCGPEPMLAALARLALPRGIPGEVSLETPMACGFGACFSCVARIRESAPTSREGEALAEPPTWQRVAPAEPRARHQRDWDYRRTCIEGPVFPIDRVVF